MPGQGAKVGPVAPRLRFQDQPQEDGDTAPVTATRLWHRAEKLHMGLFGKFPLQYFTAIARFTAGLAVEAGSETLFIHSLNQ